MRSGSTRIVTTVTFLGLAAATAAQAPAATIVEHFNDYGADSNLYGLGAAGNGWAGAWTGTVPLTDTPFTLAPLYDAGAALTFNSPNYGNVPNQTGADDGLATRGPGATASHYAHRSLSSGLAGTVWVSALARYTSSNADTILTLDATDGTANSFVAIRNRDASLRSKNGTAAVTTDTNEFGAGADNVYAANSTYLFLLRIQMNVSANNDQVDFWIFDNNADTASIPSLPSSVAGLPATPSFSKLGDFYGATFDAIGVAFEEDGSQIDSIRISNDVDGFTQVTAVPEPAGALLAGMTAFGLCVRRRRA